MNEGKEIRTIVLSGGPCAGKSSALKALQKEFSNRGYRVLAIPETATELIQGGIAPWTEVDNKHFQNILLELQLKKEELFLKSAHEGKEDRFLIICDRGAMDNRAYLSEDDFQWIMKENHVNRKELLDRYEAIFHLESCASGNVEAYTLGNNEARKETPEEARKLDAAITEAWMGHPCVIPVPTEETLEEKIDSLINKVDAFLEGNAVVRE